MAAKILLVEDNPDNVKLMSWVLEDLECEITHAPSGEAALDLISQHHFELILMDVGLPGLNGEDTTRIIRRNREYASVPIVAVTAHALHSEVERIMSAGFTTLVTKPIDEDSFLDIIKQLLPEKD